MQFCPNSAKTVAFGSRGSGLDVLEADILPDYILKRCWYGPKDKGHPVVRVCRLVPLPTGAPPGVLLAVLQVAPPHCLPERYFLPLGFATVPREERPTPFCIADAQLFGTGGILLDATADDEFVRTVLSTIVDAAAAVRVSPDLVVHRTFTPLGLERELQTADIRRGDAEQSNTSIILGHIAILKLIRKLHHGVHPEPEVGYFLSEVAKI